MISGWPADCWRVARQDSAPTLWQVFPDWQDRLTQWRAAMLIDLAYDNPALARQQALDWGALSAVTVGGASDWMPLTFFADFGTWQLFWSAGSNTDQLALQAFSATLGPSPWRGMNVLRIHGQAADITLARLTALGYDPSRPLLLAGHSYGGSIAALTAVALQDADRNRVVRVITFGMPKIGDEASALHASTVPSAHLVNRGDSVPDLPPSLGLVGALFPLPPTGAATWSDWFGPPVQRAILEPDGEIVYTQDSATGWGDYLDAVNAAVNGDPIPTTFAHEIKLYQLRLALGLP